MESYALAAALAAAAAAASQNGAGTASTSMPPDPSQLMSAATLAAAPQNAPNLQQAAGPRLGAGGSSAFAQYKPLPRPQLCAPPVHGPPQPSITLGPGVLSPQPLRPTPLQLPGPAPGAQPSGGLGTPMPTTVQGLAEMLQAVAAAQQMQAAGAAPGAPQQPVSAPPAAAPATASAAQQDAVQEPAAGLPPAMPAVAAPAPVVSSAKSGAGTEKLRPSRTRYQEKNRRAQARFRERQKTKQSEISQRMAELEATLAALTVERDQLSIRATTLQQCLAQRQVAPGAAATEAEAAASSGAGGHGSHSSGSHMSSGSSGEAPREQSRQQAVSGSEGSGTGGSAGRHPADRPQRDLPQSWDEVARWYEGIIQKMAPLLAPAQTGEEPQALARVEALWSEVNEVFGGCFSSDEALRTRAHTGACLPEGAAPVPPPTPELWAEVAAALQLTQEQVAAMVGARREFLASLKALLQQRRALNAIIGASVIKDLDSNPAVSVQHNKCVEVVHLLERNTREQCRLNTKLGRWLWDTLMTPLQGATACVGTYPFVPDKLAIMTAVATRAGEPDAALLLAADVPPSSQPRSSPAAGVGTLTDSSSAMGSGSD